MQDGVYTIKSGPVTVLNGKEIARILRDYRRDWIAASQVDPTHPEDTAPALSVLEDVITAILPDNLQAIARCETVEEVNVWRGDRLVATVSQ